MAYGHELILGFRGREKIDEVAASLGLRIEGWDYVADIGPEDTLIVLNSRMRATWLDAIAEIGLEILGPDTTKHSQGRYFNINTPLGPRNMVTWSIGLEYNPQECGDELGDAILGVSLISRYYPTFLDWADPHGGSGCVISLNTKTLNDTNIARKHIGAAYSIFDRAEIHIKEIHY